MHILHIHAAGGAVTGLSANQIAVSRVRVSWTAPPHVPLRGYGLTVASAGINMTVQALAQELTISPLGPHTIVVEPLSMHYPSTPMQTSVTVVGKPFTVVGKPFTVESLAICTVE